MALWTKPVVIYVQSLLGIGHLMRMQRIAHAIARAGVSVHVINGSAHSNVEHHSNIQWHQLPALSAKDSDFSGLVDASMRAPDAEFWQKRAKRLQSIIQKLKPGVLIIEGYPFARGSFHQEIAPWIVQARIDGWRCICSVRDIIVAKSKPGWHETVYTRLNTYFDQLLIHADDAFVSLQQSFSMFDKIDIKITYTGYIAPNAMQEKSIKSQNDSQNDCAKDIIIVSAGGGGVGKQLFEIAFNTAQTAWGQRFQWQFFGASAYLSSSFEHIKIFEFDHYFVKRLRSAKLSISQAGYNSCVELWQTRVPAIWMPFALESTTENEQLIRANLMERAGYGYVLHQNDPSQVATLGARALSMTQAKSYPDLNGATKTAQIICKYLEH